jgi:hypothetical protein
MKLWGIAKKGKAPIRFAAYFERQTPRLQSEQAPIAIGRDPVGASGQPEKDGLWRLRKFPEIKVLGAKSISYLNQKDSESTRLY